MNRRLGTRGALISMLMVVLATSWWVLTSSPMLIGAASHVYADSRTWLGIPNAWNVLVNVPLFWLAVWGWCATRAAAWPQSLRVPWQWFHLGAMVSALTSAMYHAVPSSTLFVVSHIGQASGFMLLAFGVLAERVDRRFGLAAVCSGVVGVIGLTGAAMLSGSPHAAIDLRPLMLLEAIPVLLIVAGTVIRPGSFTRASTWILMMALYAAAKLFEASDAMIFRASGVISGHSLMHLSLAMAVGCMAYFASVSASRSSSATGSSVAGVSQRSTSLNTTA